MDDAQQLMKEAARRGYSFKPAGGGKFKTIRPVRADAEFESRLAENKVAVLAVLNGKMPSNRTSNPRADAASSDRSNAGRHRQGILSRLNADVNRLIAPEVPSEKSLDPNFPAEHFSSLKESLKTVARTVIPESASGKAIGLATLPFGGEGALSKAASVALPATAGGAVGALTGEGGLSGTAQGLLGGAAGRVPELGSDIAHGAAQLFTRGRTMRMLDNARMSETLGHVVDLPGVWAALKRGTSSWADVFAAKASTGEAGARLESAREAIQNNLLTVGDAADKELDKAFTAKFGIPWKTAISKGKGGAAGTAAAHFGLPGAGGVSPAIYRGALAASEASNFYRAVGARFKSNMKLLRSTGAAAYTHGFTNDSLKPGASAVEAAEKHNQVLESINKDLSRFNQLAQQFHLNMPDFKAAFDAANDQYSKFAAIRDMADTGLESIRAGKPMQKTIIDALRENPRPFEGRLKDDYLRVKEAVRRGADDIVGHDIENTDLPSLLQSARIWTHNPLQGRFGFSGMVGAMSHPAGKYIGKAPPIFSKVAPGLLIRSAGKGAAVGTNRLLDLTRKAPVLVNSNVTSGESE